MKKHKYPSKKLLNTAILAMGIHLMGCNSPQMQHHLISVEAPFEMPAIQVPVYPDQDFPKSYAKEAEDGEYSWQYFIGFDTEDIQLGHLGELVDVDESTVNTLFVVERPNGEEILIPAQETFIEDIDHEKRLIKFNLPDGLLD